LLLDRGYTIVQAANTVRDMYPHFGVEFFDYLQE
jgi:hypothetical protein